MDWRRGSEPRLVSRFVGVVVAGPGVIVRVAVFAVAGRVVTVLVRLVVLVPGRLVVSRGPIVIGRLVRVGRRVVIRGFVVFAGLVLLAGFVVVTCVIALVTTRFTEGCTGRRREDADG